MASEAELDNPLGEEAIIDIRLKICVNLCNLRKKSPFLRY